MKKVILGITCIFFMLSSYSCLTLELQENTGCIYGDCENGFGIKRNRSGIYIGEWSNGRMHGSGIFRHKYGYRYVGQWDIDLRHGHGKLILDEGIAIGNWSFDKMVGEFDYKSKNATFIGEFISHYDYPFFFPLKGELIWSDGSRYKGEFGCIEGKGKTFCGIPLGMGEYMDIDGSVFKGYFSSKIVKPFFSRNHYIKGTIKTEQASVYYILNIVEEYSPIIFKFEDVNQLSLEK